MTKTFTSLFLLAALVFSPSIIPAQSSSCPGVPGACGYPKNNTSAQRPSLSPMDGSGTLGNVYTVSKCGLNFTAGSVKLGQRFTPAGAPQPAAISITGLPSCDSIEKAFLWVEGSGTGASQTVTLAPPSGPAQNFPMTVIGTGPDKCWGYTGSYTYYADVTSAITGNGNYMISNVLTNPPNAGEDMDGATLLIVYCDPMGAYQGTIVIDDGAIEISGGVANYDMTYPAVCGATQNAQAFCCVGDIQMPVASLTLNGTNAPFTWDWWNYVSVGTTVSIGQTTSNFNLNTPNDCFNFCVAGLYYQTTTCATCQPSPTTLALTPTSTQASCSACDGTASVTPNPSGPYNYSWLPGGQTSQTATNLCSGSYTVTVSANCILSTATVTVSNPANLAATAAQTNVSCNAGSDGTATVSPSGGTGPYTYSWSPSGGTGPTASGLSAGLYVCTITDANGCTFQQGVIITQPAPMALNVIGTNVQCNGMNNGSAVAAVSGGSPGYSYSWSPAGGTGDTATALSPGNYSVTITDANGCSAGGSVAITEPPVLTDMITTVPVGCFGMGSATASPSGGSGSYTFQWQTGGTSATEANLTVGTYTVLITDANGCFLVDTANITSVGAITVQPSYTNISCFGNNNGTATVNSSGGNPPYSYSWSPSGGNNATATNLTPGTYTCTITDANGCTATQTFNIVQPPQITST
ncbi:MAG TPA: SprB repeat-containing protein, partial [Bacteroidia bacterium]|nr:SprB repeat-containing protein [Bacteroidia bacterium]